MGPGSRLPEAPRMVRPSAYAGADRPCRGPWQLAGAIGGPGVDFRTVRLAPAALAEIGCPEG
jgi:hypothetical protein